MKKNTAMRCLIILAIVLAASLVVFSGCVEYKNWMPQDGPWFCEELQLQISFSYGDSYAVIGETQVRCDCINDPGSKSFFVITQEESDGLEIGTCLLEAEYVELTDSVFVVKECRTGTIYTFLRGTLQNHTASVSH